MTPVALAFLALACSIFGTTSEPTYHGSSLTPIPDTRATNRRTHLYTNKNKESKMRQFNINVRSKRQTNDDPCLPFTYKSTMRRLTSPKNRTAEGESIYTKNTTCFTTIEAPEANQGIELTFLDIFEMERHRNCENDYLEIRDGRHGYATPMYKFCGVGFPPTIKSTGPFLWLKFRSDDTLEYAGFVIDIDFPARPSSKRIPDSCYITIKGQISGNIDANNGAVKSCRDQTPGALDIQWKIETVHNTQEREFGGLPGEYKIYYSHDFMKEQPEGAVELIIIMSIYLNITKFQLASPNNCENNSVQVFGAEPNFDHELGTYCSSVAVSLTTKSKGPGPSNIMYVRMFTNGRSSNFSADFTAFRVAEACDKKTEFDCMDGTCIDESLRCNGISNCRLKADEDPTDCKGEAQSLMKDNRTIMIIFSLILSAIIFVLVFKCARKLYQDQKKINEYRANLCDMFGPDKMASLLSLNPPGPGSLDQENQANEICRQKIQQKSNSVDSDLLQVPVEDWLESVPVIPEDIKIEHKRPTRDLSQREELLRGKSSKEEKEKRDMSAENPGLQEAECQTRESLFLTDPIPKPSGTKSGSISRVVSGAGEPPPSPSPLPSPAPAASEVTIQLPRQCTVQDTTSAQTQRPMSSETTRSAPDVIIVSKPC